MLGSQSTAEQIDLRLDVEFAGGDAQAGGLWTLFARSDGQGIFSLGVDLLDVDSVINFSLPTGVVNGSDPAGFATQINTPITGGRRLIAGQLVLDQSVAEQGVFYGVGTLTNGSPDFPSAPGGTNQIGPNLTSLTSPQNIPWATTDPLWQTGVTVASGTFSPGVAPRFAAPDLFPMGSIFTTVGTVSAVGAIASGVTLTTELVTNLPPNVSLGDYNGDGVVDAADYTVWRDNLGQLVVPGTLADGSGNGLIDTPDFDLWASQFGESVPAMAVATPEPSASAMMVLAVTILSFRSQRTEALVAAVPGDQLGWRGFRL